MASQAPSASPVALITGGASGIGLAVAKDLAAKHWNITIVDYNAKALASVGHEFGEDTILLFKGDIADYESQAKAFALTWEKWHRLDFVFANAGVGDKIDFYAPAAKFLPDLLDMPAKPDDSVLGVDLNAAAYSAYLAFHLFRRNPSKAGKLVFTASEAGLYPADSAPLYTAAKHGVVGLTRALAKRMRGLGEPITVNCICPGLVATSMTEALTSTALPDIMTPMSTIVRAVTQFVTDDSRTGQVVECSGDNLYYRETPGFADEKAEWVMGDKLMEAMENMGVQTLDTPKV